MPRRDHIHADRDGMGADAVYGVSGGKGKREAQVNAET